MEEEDTGRSAAAHRRAAPSPSTTFDQPAWLTISQLCRRWQLDRKTIYKFIDANLLPAWRVGSHLYRVSVADVIRFEGRNRLRPK
jgi:excisionase family DNA binding protein